MYGTVARVHLKPGTEAQLKKVLDEHDRAQVPGYVGTMLFQTDADPQEAYMVAVFDSKESYVANADSPEQDERYRRYRELLDAEPEWHDGEIVRTSGLLAT